MPVPSPPPSGTAPRLAWAGSAALLLLIAGLSWLYVVGAPAVPFSDEAGHLAAAWEMLGSWIAADSASESLHALAAPTGSYPGLLSAISQLTMALVPGIDAVRAAAAVLVVLHAAVALSLGPRLWGWPATWLYVALCCSGPILLSLSTLALLDGPSTALSGITLLLLLRSDGFRRPGMAAAFALLAAAALYTKWVVLVFLAPPVAVEIGRALLSSSERPATRLVLAAGMSLLAAGLATLVWRAGSSAPVELALRDVARPWAFLAGPTLGLLTALGLGAGGAAWTSRGRSLPPALVAAVAVLIVVLIAGPWYAGAWSDLLGRLQHETAMYAHRDGRAALGATQLARDLLDLSPLLPLALLPGLGLAIAQRRHLASVLALLGGGLLGAGLVARILPPDLRYLLPAIPPLAAAAAVSLGQGQGQGLGQGPRWLVGGLAVVVVPTQLALAAVGHGPHRTGVPAANPAGASVQRRLPPPLPPLPVGRLATPDPLDDAAVDSLLSELEAAGMRPGSLELVVYQGEAQPVQGRAVRALGLHRGQVVPTLDANWQAPLEPLAPAQLALAAACPIAAGQDSPEPLARIPTRPPLCDLGLFRGAVPAPP